MSSVVPRMQPQDQVIPPDEAEALPPDEQDAGGTGMGRMAVRTGKNMMFLSISFVSQMAAQILLLSIVGRLAGVDIAGVWSYVISFTDPFSVIMDFGTTRFLVPEIARRREESDLLLGNALMLEMFVGIPALIALAVIANLGFLHHTSAIIQALYLGGLAMLLSTLSLSVRSALRAFNRFDLEALNSVLVALALVGSSLAVLLFKAPTMLLFAVPVGAYTFALMNSVRLYNRHLGQVKLRYDPAIFRQVLGKTWVFMFINLFYRAYMRIDVLIIRYFHGTTAVGYYGLVTALFYSLDVITRLLMTSMLPTMTRSYMRQRGQQMGQYMDLALKVQILAVLPITLIGLVLARQIIMLLYGPGYEPSILFLQLLILALPLRFINRTFSIALTAMDMQFKLMVALILAVVFNLAANFLAIPPLAGLGATITSMVSEVVLCFLMYFFLTVSVRQSVRWGSTIARPLLATLILVPFLILMRHWPLLISLPFSLAIYAVALFLVRAFSAAEVQVVSNLIEAAHLPPSLRRRLVALMQARTHG